MKPSCELWRSRETEGLSRRLLNDCIIVGDALERTKETLLAEYSSKGFNGRALDLALNEAEALAWQTDYPHLVFPVLAAEKVNTAVAWQQRQQAITQKYEVAFAV